MQRKWKRGDLVTVVTVNGLAGLEQRARRGGNIGRRDHRAVAGGAGLVEREAFRSRERGRLGSYVYAVPAGEIGPRKR